MQSPITRANVTVMVSEISRSLDFYTRVLGFREGARHGDHFVEVEAAGLTIVLHPGRRETTRGHSNDNLSIGLQVLDLAEATRELGSKGLSFTYQENEANRLALFGDPDGTPIYLLEVKATAREQMQSPRA
jgi:catechol 2,3-dioxygenase-like lactoylglutathione lyase family enzyme